MRFLVPLDGTQFSEAILEPVARAAKPLGATIELLAVRKPEQARETPSSFNYRETVPAAAPNGTRLHIPTTADLVPPPAETREQAVERAEAELRDYLVQRAHQLEGITCEVRAIIAHDAAEAIIKEAKATGADLIAMTTHGRHGISHLINGSVTEKVIRSGVAPVLVLKP